MVFKGKTVFICVPCYNVAEHIAAVVNDIPPFVDGVVLVDDASRDTTPQILDGLKGTSVTVIHRAKNGGVGAAMVDALKEAYQQGAELMVKVDGDGQMDLRFVSQLLDALETHDYAKGNRLLDRIALSTMPRQRRFANFGLTFLTKLASGYWNIGDPQNGFIAIRRETWALIDQARLAPGYFFENDMLVNLNIVNALVKDVRMPARYGGERSSVRALRVLPSFVRLLISRTGRRFYMKYMLVDFSPIALFVLTGVPLFLWGVFFGLYAWWDNSSRGVPASAGTVMLSVLPLLMGFQLLLQALVLDIQQTPRQ